MKFKRGWIVPVVALLMFSGAVTASAEQDETDGTDAQTGYSDQGNSGETSPDPDGNVGADETEYGMGDEGTMTETETGFTEEPDGGTQTEDPDAAHTGESSVALDTVWDNTGYDPGDQTNDEPDYDPMYDTLEESSFPYDWNYTQTDPVTTETEYSLGESTGSDWTQYQEGFDSAEEQQEKKDAVKLKNTGEEPLDTKSNEIEEQTLTEEDWKRIREGSVLEDEQPTGTQRIKLKNTGSSSGSVIADIKNDTKKGNDAWVYLMWGLILVGAGLAVIAAVVISTVAFKKKRKRAANAKNR